MTQVTASNDHPGPSPIDEAVIARWSQRLRAAVPDSVAVILKGSYARGDAGTFSDVDFDVLTAGGEREEYLAFLEEIHGGRLVHVSVAVRDLAGWLAEEAEPVIWSFGLPAREATRLLWAVSAALANELDRSERLFPAGEPELEDFVAGLAKVKQARTEGAELALRLAAQEMARLCPSVLRLINPEVRVRTRQEALLAALAFPVSPPGYRDDMLVCLGLAGQATTTEDVCASASRLIPGVLETLRPHAALLAPSLPPELANALADGTLQRYAAQTE